MSAVLDYLIKIAKKQNQNLIEKLNSGQLKIQMKILGSEEVLSVRLRSSVQNNIYVIQFKGQPFKGNESITFRFDFESRVYFFKTTGIEDTKSIYLDQNSDIFELVRRKQPRFNVPSDWFQEAIVLNALTKNIKTKADVKEISVSGMKLNLRSDLPRFLSGQKIIVQFKIYKRASITVDGLIRHSRKNKSAGSTVGIEFQALTVLTQRKIQNVLDDICYDFTHQTNKI